MKITIPSDKDGEWHRWFAWHPAIEWPNIYWLETVERKWDAERFITFIHPEDTIGTQHGMWEYRDPR